MASRNKSRKIQLKDANSMNYEESDESEDEDEVIQVPASRTLSQLKKRSQSKAASRAKTKYKTELMRFECWTMFVNFSQCPHSSVNIKDDIKDDENIFSKRWNPYQASVQYVAVYMALLKNVTGLSEKELGFHLSVLGKHLPSLHLEKKGVRKLLELNDEQLLIPGKLEDRMENNKSYSINMPGLKVWNSFIWFCLEKHSGKVDPFHTDARGVRDYIENQMTNWEQFDHFEQLKKIGLQAAETFYVQSITSFCEDLGKFIKLGYNGKDLLSCKPIIDLLLAGEHLDCRIPSKSSLVTNLAPSNDYTQYHAQDHQNEKFWEIGSVREILQEVSNKALDNWKSAWQLGVTEDMMNSALQVNKKDPEINLTLEQYVEKGYGNKQQFWVEVSTMEVLNQVRDRNLTVANVAFMFGVSRSQLLEKVGRIKSEEEIYAENQVATEAKRKEREESRAKKPTQLQMQIKMAEDNLENLSDYERLRLQNLRERKALLGTLNIEDDKKAMKEMTPSRRNLPVEYGRREKSTRLKRKVEKVVHQVSNVAVPQVDLDMKEVFSTNTNYHAGVRFINSISEEVKDVAEGEASAKSPFNGFSKIVDSKVSDSEICSIDTFGDLVCFGDSSGGVGVFMDGSSTTWHIHNKPVTRTLFVRENQSCGILSSSQDGTVRLTDLTKQKVVVKYSWIQSGKREQIGWIEPLDGSNFLMNSNRNSVKKMDLRSKKVDTLFSLTDETFMSPAAILWDEFSKDAKFGTNIGVHPTNRNLISICHQFHVKIFDLRNTSQPVNTINVDQLHPTGEPSIYHTNGISGANWSPVSGKYFLACPVKQPIKITICKKYKQYHKPYIFDSSNLTNPVQTWPAIPKSLKEKKSMYESARFSSNFGSNWCPWEEGVYFTTAQRAAHLNIRHSIPTHFTVVAIDASTGDIVAEISEDLGNSTYLIDCHKKRNWVVVGNARGPGDLVIYHARE